MAHAKRREFLTHKANENNNQVVRSMPKAFGEKLEELKIGICCLSFRFSVMLLAGQKRIRC
jgi:hypothetical protein